MQQIVVTLLYYARAVDPIILVALGSIAVNQAKRNETTAQAIKQLVYYCATHPDSTIRYKQLDMLLCVRSDGSYLSESQACSRSGVNIYIFRGAKNNQNDNKWAIITISHIIKNVMASASEVEFVALFINTKEAVEFRTTLEEMGYSQPATPIPLDKSTYDGIMNWKMQQKLSREIYMCFYCVRDRVKQKHFDVFCKPGLINLGCIFNKHHSRAHNKGMRPI